MTMTTRPRLDLAPAVPYLDAIAADVSHDAGPTVVLARLLGLSRRAAARIHREGAIAEHHADTIAAALNLHPLNLWPEWADLDQGDATP